MHSDSFVSSFFAMHTKNALRFFCSENNYNHMLKNINSFYLRE